MSEADTPNNQPHPEPSGATSDQAANELAAPEAPDNPPLTNPIPELPKLGDVVQPWRQGRAITPLSLPAATSLGDDEASESLESPRGEHAKDADWFALAQKMRQRNRRLLDQVTQLRQSLRERQEELNIEQSRSRDRDTLMAQQAEELSTVQEQLTRMFNTLESSHQASQRQQILIETLSEQLQSSQERVAQLERECAMTQQRYNEQSHQLLQAANTCRELRSRLHRQQRQALQFKAALEKSLEMPSSGSASSQPAAPAKNTNAAQTIIHKAQPIQPWSAEPELVEESGLDPIWNRPIRLEPLETTYASDAEPVIVQREETDPAFSTADTARPVETTVVAFSDSEAKELELEQQLLAEMSSLAEASGLSEEFQSEIAATQTPEPNLNPEPSFAPTLYLSHTDATVPPNNNPDQLDIKTEIASEGDWVEPAAQDVRLPQSSWPSPVLYPLRPPKKRQSLASIDLPSFPRYRPV